MTGGALGVEASEDEDLAGTNITAFFTTNLFDHWLLCGVNGSCMNLEPMAMTRGGENGVSMPSNGRKQGINLKVRRVTFKPTPVCVYPPFVFIVSNISQQNLMLNCTNDTCFYAQCWDAARVDLAIIARMPRWVPVPVDAPHAMTLFRQKRDFGITAAIITAISLAAVAATTAAIAMSQSLQTAHALNNLSSNVAQALDVQTSVNAQLRGGLMVVNQRIDLVQEQIDTL